MQCVLGTAKFRPKTELCFDAARGVLVREGTNSSDKSTQFSDYFEFRGKLFPRVLTILEGKTVQREVEVLGLTYDPDPDLSLFETDAQYKVIAGCEHPVPPRPLKLPDPEYPQQLRTQGPKKVKLSAIVNEAGGVQDITVTSSAGAVDQYAIKALEKWKFAAATCGAIPVPFQFFTEVNFRTY